jgi:hypothetical protein
VRFPSSGHWELYNIDDDCVATCDLRAKHLVVPDGKCVWSR